MSDAVFIICLMIIFALIGTVAVLLVVLLLNVKDPREGKENVAPGNFYSQTAVGRYWHIEIWNATTNRLFKKDFCGQVMLGRSTPTTEPFWQMRIGEDRTISKEQCVVYDRSGFLVIENLSQVNITMLNGYPITTPMILQEGCQVSMGNNVFYITTIRRAM